MGWSPSHLRYLGVVGAWSWGGGLMVCAADVIFSEQTFRTCASLDGAWTSSIWGLQTRSAKNRIRALITSPGELHADRSWERIITTETEENF